MKGTELKKLLIKGGCYKYRDGTNHDIWISPKTGERFSVPRHDSKEIPIGTCNRILKDAGLK